MRLKIPGLLASLFAACLSGPFMLANASANTVQASEARGEESLASLGVGSVEIKFHQIDANKTAVDFSTDLDNIVGATVSVPGQRKNIVNLQARDRRDSDLFQTASAEADVSIGSDSLAGPRLHLIIATNLTRERVIQLVLLSKTGTAYTVRLHKASWAEGQVALNLAGSGRCITYRASCSACTGTIEKECCGSMLDVCIDCQACKIDCDNRCTLSE